jgi:ATP-dependent RNA helicase MSS116
VFDEADRLLDQGFKKDIYAIMEFLPKKEAGRQTLLFSATIGKDIKKVSLIS